MPVSQNTSVDSTSAAKQSTAPAIDPRDLEPKLVTKSIAVYAPIITGSLHLDAATGGFKVNVSQNAEVDVAAYGMAFEAWLDEAPGDLETFPYVVQFLILAITEHSTIVAPSGLGIEMYEYDSDNEPDLPMHITYSGTGLILVQAEEYLHRSDFQSRSTAAKMKLEQYRAMNSPISKGSNEEWNAKCMQDDINALEGLIAQLGQHVGTEEENRHFRRMGVLRFQDWDEDMYRSVMRGPFTEFWLD